MLNTRKIKRETIYPAGGCRISITLLVILMTFLVSGNIPVKGQIISISSKFDTTSIWIGEQTFFTITVEQPAEMHVGFPVLSDTLSANIEILSAYPADTTLIDGEKLRINKNFRITSFERGEQFVESLPFVFFVDDDERVLKTPRVKLEVLSPEIDQEANIYDIKDPFSIPLGFMEILPWILLVVAIALLSWYLVRYYKRRKPGESEMERAEPAEPAHVIALRELKQLKSDSLWQKGYIKDYYSRLTEIVRIYIERRFGILAMERTSDEIIEELNKSNSVEPEVIDLLKECFSLADLVKFAKGQPGEAEHETSLNTAFHFIKASWDLGAGSQNALNTGSVESGSGNLPGVNTGNENGGAGNQGERNRKKQEIIAPASGVTGSAFAEGKDDRIKSGISDNNADKNG